MSLGKSHYTLIAPDGTRREVFYDRCHDGPVSQRLFLGRRIRFFSRRLERFPADLKLRSKLAEASRELAQLDRDYPRVQSPPHRTAKNRRNGHRLDTRADLAQPAPVTIEPAPSAAASQLVRGPFVAPAAPIG